MRGLGEFADCEAGDGAAPAEDFGGDVDLGFVDEAGVEEGCVHVRAAFDHKIGVFLRGEFLQQQFEVEAGLGAGEFDDHDAAGREGVAAFGGSAGEIGGTGDHDGGEGDGADEQRVERQAALGIEHDAGGDAFDVAGVFGAGHEVRVVGESGADADENGINAAAEFLHIEAALFAADPFGFAAGGGDAAVE